MSLILSPAPATERTSPVRASVTFRFARSSTGLTGAGSGFGSFLKSFIRTMTRSTPRMATSVNVIMYVPSVGGARRLGSGLLVGFDVDGQRAARSRDFLGEIGRGRLLALGLEGCEFGIDAAGS